MVAVGGYFRQLAERSGLNDVPLSVAASGNDLRFDGSRVTPLEQDVVVEAGPVESATSDVATTPKPVTEIAQPASVESERVLDAPIVLNQFREVRLPQQSQDGPDMRDNDSRQIELRDTPWNAGADLPESLPNVAADRIENTRRRSHVVSEPEARTEMGMRLRDRDPVAKVAEPSNEDTEFLVQSKDGREQTLQTAKTSRAVESSHTAQPRQPVSTPLTSTVELRIGSVNLEIHQPPPPAQKESLPPPSPPKAAPRERRASFSANRYYLRTD